MTKLTTELLEKFVNDIKADGMCDITDSQVESALIRLLAYEQAAEKPYGYLEPFDFPRTTATVYPEKDKYAFMPLYAAPVLPKQPIVLYMGRELISKEGLELIRDGVSEATKLEGACMASTILGGNHHAQPVSEPYKLKDAVEDIRNSGVEIDTDKIKAERDALNSPVIPEGSVETNCIWSTDSDGVWLGDCGLTWTFFDDGPNENGLKYCPSCGKKISVITAPAQEQK